MDLTKLNLQQQKAVTFGDGPLMVMAGAGSGKTRVLTYRIAYLIEEYGISPESILAVTFTNKAAREMKERVDKLISKDSSGMWISTFHSFGARFLRKEIGVLGTHTRGFIIIDEDDSLKIIKKILKDYNLSITPKEAVNYISDIKNEEYIDDKKYFDSESFIIMYNHYQDELCKNNLVDFDDLLKLTVDIIRSNPLILEKYQNKFSYILIDEFQDTNKLQFELINLLMNKNKNIFVVGDMNQSIYSFRGARVSNVADFKKEHHPDIIKLEENYRSTATILDIANDVIRKNESFVDMTLFTRGEPGEKSVVYKAENSYSEVIFIESEIKRLVAAGYNYKDFAIIYRLNSLSLAFETEFVKAKIPYIIYGGVGYFGRKEVKDIVAYLRLILNNNDDFSFKRIVNVPKRKIGEKQIESLEAIARERRMSLYQAIEYSDNNLLNNFKNIIEKLKEKVDKVTLVDLIEVILDETGYMQMLKQEEEDERIDNVMELKTIMKDLMETYENQSNSEILEAFLNDLALKTDVDNVKESDNKVKLMNFHQAKGLEYPIVFLPAMEEGIFPSYQSLSNNVDKEEERRICYVGITRAMSKLYFSYADIRRIYGNDRPEQISEFMRDISERHLEFRGSVCAQYNRRRDFDDDYETPEVLKCRFKVGEKVIHKVFGKGVVVQIDGQVVKVAFGLEFGVKNLSADHPSLSKLDDSNNLIS